MAAPKRTEFERERDLTKTASLYLRGQTQAEIAAHLKVSQRQISYDLKVLQRRWQQSALVDIDAAKGRELAKIDAVEREAWRGWRRSLKDAVKTIQAARDDDGVKKLESREERQGQAGDPRFLTIVQGCIERRCKIFGLDAAIKISWQEQAKADGYDPESILSGMESAVFTALVQAGAGGGLPAGESATPDAAHDAPGD